jgi:hypothetical protein
MPLTTLATLRLATAFAGLCTFASAQPPPGASPADHLPPHIRHLTHFTDFAGYKATNGVVSDNGRWMAFQMGFSGDEPGIGHGIFVMDLEAVR